MESIINFENADCAYGNEIALRGISLEVKKGQFIGIVGPSGSGKTTLLKAILGLVNIPKGSITVKGKKINGIAPSGIGYVPQLESIDWNFPVTVEQIVLMGLHDQGSIFPWSTTQELQKVQNILEDLGMTDYTKRHISQLSGGQQQRVFLSRALIRKPQILLLDEPTNGIDVKTRHNLLHLLKDLNNKGMTIILTTHDLNAVAAHLPWIVCFNKHLIAQGPPGKVFTPKILSETYEAPLKVIRHTGVVGNLPFVTEIT